ncbi:ABC-type nitrate/sulfonate/bicarbonate transport system, ATPase component [Candidatus Scalindua japonica]|uniref:ABC-type nitrate/sulfonate/bicarbonate transport system, ATPase component n=1 Tax=Candidatus Scalindua japonica TaxID=1284222 RepID=A0A286TYU5_9BACT|nr:hypothetical protein [Candidatus Scalindua japonica]GAX61028.1 ABC-type nitrate/sulfonate/bicarbonate transport system, ATPase component [Candidatus Scalindua japonica]
MLIDPYVEDLKFEDKDVSFQFVPTSEHIWVSIYNKTENSIYFDADKAEYIGPSGESNNILFGWRYSFEMWNYISNNRYINPIRVGPKSISEGNIWINIWPGPGGDFGDGWTSVTGQEIDYLDHGMLPEYSYEGDGKVLKDSTFFLILPIQFDSYLKNYEFIFMIKNVEIENESVPEG